MKWPFVCVVVLFLLSSIPVPTLAQGRGGRAAGNAPGDMPSILSTGAISGSLPPAAFLSGKVAIDDGSDLTDPAAIQLICHGQRHTAGYTDRKGGFSFQLTNPADSAAADVADAGTSLNPTTASRAQRNWRDCELQAVLAGYSSEVVELASRMDTLQSVDLGTVTLHRLEHVEGTSISVTSLIAPNSAKKALEKAREDEKKGKWDLAQQSLQKAVRIYPKYAVAWSELGRIQMRLNDPVSAKKSFEQSLAADSKYVNAYDGLAQLAFAAKQWPQVIETTNKLLALNPVNFLAAYLFNGVAHYEQGELDAAEKITREGIRVDDGHQVPRLQYLLGMILLRKHEYQQASEQMQQYLNLVKEPAQVEEAKKQLAEIARLSASSNSSGVPVEK